MLEKRYQDTNLILRGDQTFSNEVNEKSANIY